MDPRTPARSSEEFAFRNVLEKGRIDVSFRQNTRSGKCAYLRISAIVVPVTQEEAGRKSDVFALHDR